MYRDAICVIQSVARSSSCVLISCVSRTREWWWRKLHHHTIPSPLRARAFTLIPPVVVCVCVFFLLYYSPRSRTRECDARSVCCGVYFICTHGLLLSQSAATKEKRLNRRIQAHICYSLECRCGISFHHPPTSPHQRVARATRAARAPRPALRIDCSMFNADARACWWPRTHASALPKLRHKVTRAGSPVYTFTYVYVQQHSVAGQQPPRWARLRRRWRDTKSRANHTARSNRNGIHLAQFCVCVFVCVEITRMYRCVAP